MFISNFIIRLLEQLQSHGCKSAFHQAICCHDILAHCCPAWTAVLLGGVSSGFLALACYLLRALLIGIFTSDKDVTAASLTVFPIMCATILTDGVNVSIEGADYLSIHCRKSHWTNARRMSNAVLLPKLLPKMSLNARACLKPDLHQ